MSADNGEPFVSPPGISKYSGEFSTVCNVYPFDDSHKIQPGYFEFLLGKGYGLPAGLRDDLDWRSLTHSSRNRLPKVIPKFRLQIAEGRTDDGELGAMFVEQRSRIEDHDNQNFSFMPLVLTTAGKISDCVFAGSRYKRNPQNGLWQIVTLALASYDPAYEGREPVSEPVPNAYIKAYFDEIPFTVQLLRRLVNGVEDNSHNDINFQWQFIPENEPSKFINITSGDINIPFPTSL